MSTGKGKRPAETDAAVQAVQSIYDDLIQDTLIMGIYVVLKEDNKPVLNADITITYTNDDGTESNQILLSADRAHFGYPGAECQTRSFNTNPMALVEQIAPIILVSRLNNLPGQCIPSCRSNSSNLKNFKLIGIDEPIIHKIALLFCCYLSLYGSLSEVEKNKIYNYIIKYQFVLNAFSLYFLPGVLSDSDVALSQRYNTDIKSLNIQFKDYLDFEGKLFVTLKDHLTDLFFKQSLVTSSHELTFCLIK